ncbi:hypothetical protein RZ964_002599 [Acinetobacter baumannii]|uniref:hypothetical protein n=1 Tax=Acinetobacter baumannii TaxID=470 RepID=UPI00292880ED|nr:hypothetical protein [Acinetobacter baumannii]ELT0788310.1 hypothetical protein [Acinetobacter baumannii]
MASVGLLAACQQQVPSKQENNDQLRSVKIPVYQFNGISASARLRGPLQLKNECLYVNDVLIVFPERSAEWDAKNQTLTYKGEKIALGEELDLVGGSGQYELDNHQIKNLSPSCDHKSLWLAG